MRLNWYRLRRAAVAVALLVACSEDPTASLAGSPAGVFLAFNYVEVDVDASATVDAVVRDGSGTPLNVPVNVTSSDPQIATVTTAQDPPHVLTRVTVRGANIGTTRIIATAAGVSDSMDVATFAATLEVTDPPPVGTLMSGESQTLTFRYLSATERDLTAQVATPPTWTIDTAGAADPADLLKATVDPATGAMTGRDFGSVKVLATGPGAPAGGITGSAVVFIQPAPFQGTLTPNPSNPSGSITITAGPGETFDASTRVFLNRAAVTADPNSEGDFVVSSTASAIDVFLGDLRQAAKLELILAGVGASELSVGTGPLPTDSLTVQLPGLAGTVTPDPVDAGAVVTVSAGAGPAFDSPDTRVYFDGAQVSSAASAAERVVSITPATITLQIDDLRTDTLPDTVDVRLTRVGAAQAAQAGRFVVRAPAVFTGQLSASSGTPAQVVTITRAPTGPVFDADTRVFFDGIEAFVAEPRTADAIRVAVPVIDKIGPPVQLRMTRLGAGQEAQRSTFSSPNKAYADPYDAVNNDPNTAPLITANGDYFVVLHGGCLNGVGTGGADCDDWFQIRNTGATPATVTVNARWVPTGGDIDLLMGSDPVGIVNFDCEDGCGGATAANPEATSISIPAGATYYIWLSHFDWHSVPHSLARVRVSGLP
jgi:hypothetical protein